MPDTVITSIPQVGTPEFDSIIGRQMAPINPSNSQPVEAYQDSGSQIAPLGTKEGRVDEESPYFNGKVFENAGTSQTLYHNQGGFERTGRATANFATGTVLKAVSGLSRIPGLITGGIEGAVDSGLANTIDDAEQDVKDYFKIYKENGYADKSALSQLISSSWWADEFVDGGAFMASSILTGWGLGAGLKALGAGAKIASILNAGSKEVVLGEIGTDSAISRGLQSFLKGASSHSVAAYSTFSEALVEGAGVFKDTMKNLYEDKRTNPDTGQLYTKEEAKAIAAKNASETAYLNMAVLAVPNYIQEAMFFGASGQTGKIFQNLFEDGALKGALKAPTIKTYLKNIGKGVATGIASEGVWEENIQSAISSFESKRNSLHTDANRAEILENYLENFATDEGQKNIMAGAVLGAIGGVKGGYSDTKSDYALSTKLHVQVLHNSVGITELSNLYEKTPTGAYKIRNGERVINVDVAKKVASSILNTEQFAVSKLAALENGDIDAAKYIDEKVFSGVVRNMYETGLEKKDVRTFLEYNRKKALEEIKAPDKKGTVKEKTLTEDINKKYDDYLSRIDAVDNLHGRIQTLFGGVTYGKSEEETKAREMLKAVQFQLGIDSLYLNNELNKAKTEAAKLNTETSSYLNNIDIEVTNRPDFKPTLDPLAEKLKEKNEKKVKGLQALVEENAKKIQEYYDMFKQEDALVEELKKKKLSDDAQVVKKQNEAQGKTVEPSVTKEDIKKTGKSKKELEDLEILFKEELKGKTVSEVQEIYKSNPQFLDKDGVPFANLQRLANAYMDNIVKKDAKKSTSSGISNVEEGDEETFGEPSDFTGLINGLPKEELKTEPDVEIETSKPEVDEDLPIITEEPENDTALNSIVISNIYPSTSNKIRIDRDGNLVKYPGSEKYDESILANPTITSGTEVEFVLDGTYNKDGVEKDILAIKINGKLVSKVQEKNFEKDFSNIVKALKQGKKITGTITEKSAGNGSINSIVNEKGNPIFFPITQLFKGVYDSEGNKKDKKVSLLVVKGNPLTKSAVFHALNSSDEDIARDGEASYSESGQFYAVGTGINGEKVKLKLTTKNLNEDSIKYVIAQIFANESLNDKRALIEKVVKLQSLEEFDKSKNKEAYNGFMDFNAKGNLYLKFPNESFKRVVDTKKPLTEEVKRMLTKFLLDKKFNIDVEKFATNAEFVPYNSVTTMGYRDWILSESHNVDGKDDLEKHRSNAILRTDTLNVNGSIYHYPKVVIGNYGEKIKNSDKVKSPTPSLSSFGFSEIDEADRENPYKNAEDLSQKDTKIVTDLESKKADIEKRRQKELEDSAEDIKNDTWLGIELIINAKYDAELAELEKKTVKIVTDIIEINPETSKVQVPEITITDKGIVETKEDAQRRLSEILEKYKKDIDIEIKIKCD